MTFATTQSSSQSIAGRGSGLWLAASGLVQLGLSALAARWIDDKPSFVLYLACFLGWQVVYLLSCYVVTRRDHASRTTLWWILAVAIVMRAIVLPTHPTLSDDIFRYRWDGRVQLEGINPYVYAPGSVELSRLRDEHFADINNKDISTIYPPLMQHLFYGAAWLGVGIAGLKALFVLFDLAMVALLLGILRSLGMSSHRVLIYAWNPLVVTEIAGSGHNDVAAMCLLMAAQLAILRQRRLASMVLLGLSGSAKILGFLLAPLWWRHVRPRDYLALVATALLTTLPFLPAGAAMFEGLTQYATRWRSNDSLFHVLYWLTGSLAWPKLIVGVFLTGMSVWLVARRVEPLRAAYWVTGAILLLTSTLHPWYLLWILPYLCVFASPMWLGLSATVALAYHAPYISIPGEPWQEWGFIKWLEYAPLLALGAYGAMRGLVKRSDPPGVESTHPATKEQGS